jgi:hypothetical protein
MRLRESYEKPSVKRAREKAEGIRRARKLAQKKLNRDHRTSSNFVARDKSPYFHFYQIAAAELAVYGKIEKRTISHRSFSVEKETHCPDLALLQGLLDANLLACVPSRSTQFSRIILRDTHFSSPMATIAQREMHSFRFYDGVFLTVRYRLAATKADTQPADTMV